jgi:hypothetical protein
MTGNESVDIFIGSIATIIFILFFVGLLVTPLIAVFLFVWVLTLNWIAATVLGIVAEVVYLRYFW